MGAAGGMLADVGGFGLNLAGLAVADNARKREYAYKDSALDQNARIAGQAAADSVQRGRQDEAASRMKYGALRGEQTTALAAGGVAVDQGSALDVIANTQAMSDYDAKIIHANAAREAWGYRMKQQDLQRQRNLLKQAGADEDTNTLLKAGSMTLSTIGGMAAKGGKG